VQGQKTIANIGFYASWAGCSHVGLLQISASFPIDEKLLQFYGYLQRRYNDAAFTKLLNQ
jgi:hypothetical protein